MLCKLLLLCSNFKVCFFGTSWNFFLNIFNLQLVLEPMDTEGWLHVIGFLRFWDIIDMKNYLCLRCTSWCFDICIPCEMIATIKLINIHYLYLVTISCVCVCVYVCVNRWIFTTPVSFPVPSTGQEAYAHFTDALLGSDWPHHSSVTELNSTRPSDSNTHALLLHTAFCLHSLSAHCMHDAGDDARMKGAWSLCPGTSRAIK